LIQTGEVIEQRHAEFIQTFTTIFSAIKLPQAVSQYITRQKNTTIFFTIK